MPTGEVVKVRMMRKDVHTGGSDEISNGSSHSVSKLSASQNSNSLKNNAVEEASGTGTNSQTPENVVLAGLIGKGFLKPSDSRVAKDEALARFMAKSKAFHFLGMPEFKVWS